MESRQIWFAVVGVKPLKGNEIIKGNKGAHVNVACVADSEENFRKKIKENFEYHKCKIFEICDITTDKNILVVNKSNSENIRLLNEIKEGYEFAWGTFYTF